MTRTRATPLIGLAALGLAIGFLLELGSESTGGSLLIPPISLPLTLVVVGAIIVGFSLPIRRAVTGRSKRPVDPFQSLRVVALARASSRVGALLAGVALGALIYFTTRPVMPGVGSLWLTIGSCIGAVLLAVAGLIAEHLCTLPKDDDDDAPGAPPAR
ncbi:DUF3180 domain-containing protein [Mycetocola zhujimingii]|uniref:DUF3180 domain-containing protein n=1 Tax=Mycetocola zhujimingii TaxID=2079792 RepID=A0A2U1TFU2_9MICO|nr:DUF3180 domain-containing protein [Mycetocola zhujimingii]AWB87274.1 DUF3180 domain-containing protein [Mycetocola zhujimingii]PWC07768.1 DUF3180 domain-containing protein [Mycetocola zhujimingii]